MLFVIENAKACDFALSLNSKSCEFVFEIRILLEKSVILSVIKDVKACDLLVTCKKIINCLI